MFSGIVSALGSLRASVPRGPGARLGVQASVGRLALGESIAVHGVCLTVVGVTDDGFEADASAETLARTTLGRKPVGSRLHLERPLTLADGLGGHLVTGHVDGIARVVERSAVGDAVSLRFEVDDGLAPFIATKGSIAVDGVSLTVNAVTARTFDVMIIPHTSAVTTLGALAVGNETNIEVDLVARYVARLLDLRPPDRGSAKP